MTNAAPTNILVLDDESDTEDLFQQMFRNQIADSLYSFAFTTNPEEARQLLSQQNFDIFITDISVSSIDCI